MRMHSEKVKQFFLRYWSSLVFAFCAGTLSALFPRAEERNGIAFLVCGILGTVLVWFCLDRRFRFSDALVKERDPFVVVAAASICLFATAEFCRNCYFYGWTRKCWLFFPFAGAFLLCILFYAFDRIVPLLRRIRLCRADRIVLGSVCVFLFAGAAALCASTRVFFSPRADGISHLDVLYTGDSASLYDFDAFLNMQNSQNDIRQLWFSFAALPFALPAKCLSYLLFFWKNAYAVLLIWLQCLALLAAALLFARCLRFSRAETYAFCCLFFACFAQLFFGVVIEQYIFPLFWTALFLFALCEGRRDAEALYVFNIGAFLTNAALLPCLYRKGQRFGKVLSHLLWIGLGGIGMFLLAGRLPSLAPEILEQKLREIFSYGGREISLYETFCQFTHFIRNQFLAPPISVQLEPYPAIVLPVASGLSAVGIGIFALELLCFCFVRRERAAIVSGYWVLFSLLLLGVCGWGAAENGMILYSSYFCWAYLLLPCLALERGCRKWKRGGEILFCALCGALALCLLVPNLLALCDVISFGIRYYPV